MKTLLNTKAYLSLENIIKPELTENNLNFQTNIILPIFQFRARKTNPERLKDLVTVSGCTSYTTPLTNYKNGILTTIVGKTACITIGASFSVGINLDNTAYTNYTI